MTINGRAQRVRGSEAICRMAGFEIYRYGCSRKTLVALTQDAEGLERNNRRA